MKESRTEMWEEYIPMYIYIHIYTCNGKVLNYISGRLERDYYVNKETVFSSIIIVC
jgi:hypothetical protein